MTEMSDTREIYHLMTGIYYQLVTDGRVGTNEMMILLHFFMMTKVMSIEK